MRRIAFKRFNARLAWITGGVLIGVIVINAVINPFNLFEGLRITGINDYKYELPRNSRLSKAVDLRRFHPDCLVLGSSRAQFGIDPSHPAWENCRAYNLALAAGGLYETMRYFQQAALLQRPKEAVISLDLFMMNVYRGPQGGFQEERLMTNPDGSPNPQWRRTYAYDIFSNLLSWYSLKASSRTLFPRSPRQVRGPENGYWEFRHDSVITPSRRTRREAFRRSEQAFLTEHWFPAPRRRFATRDPESGKDAYNDLRTILRLAHQHETRLFLCVSPSHARQWEALLQAGLWNEFENWKRMLVRVNDEEAKRAGRTPFAVWDFSGYNTYTTEEVPAEDSPENDMRWYWESSHFKKELGDHVLNRVLGYRTTDPVTAPDFGVRLDARNIEAHLAAVRAAQRRWQRTHASDVTEIEEITHRTRQWRSR